jgi:chemotaxis methyl-accepting protein methylase
MLDRVFEMISVISNPQPELSAADFALWRELIRQRCGLFFPESRLRFLRGRLWERMRARAFGCYGEYYRFVMHHAEGAAEWRRLLELIVVGETSFFRHVPSYEALAERVLPELLSRKRERGETTVGFWSAGCSGGQEAYSLAIRFFETRDADSFRLRVTGTDISQTALAKARRGSYREHEMHGLTAGFRQRYFTTTPGEGESRYTVAVRVAESVRFIVSNLASDDLHLPSQDVIFCQNVLMYFGLESRAAIVRRLTAQLGPGGFLFTAPAELIGLELPEIESVNIRDTLIYRRRLKDEG